MDNIVEWSSDNRKELFQETASNLGMSPAIAEKDFWVCWVLGKLFQSVHLEGKIMFKGGTSLSKVFGVIERFSEDIDLILNWSDFITEFPDFKGKRTKQDNFNKATEKIAQAYLKDSFMPILKGLIGNYCELNIDDEKPKIINIRYPASFNEVYIRDEIILETGPLASWDPHGSYNITPYAAQVFPDKFKDSEVKVQSIKAERTFWEKATILHSLAHFPEEKTMLHHYSRHYYDMMLLAGSKYKQRAFDDVELLKNVVEFKDKFYHVAWANYHSAVIGSFKLYPPEYVRNSLKKDYDDMQIMIFGEKTPTFEEIMTAMKQLEAEINLLSS